MRSGLQEPGRHPLAPTKSAEEMLEPDRLRPSAPAPAELASRVEANVARPGTARAAEWFDRMVSIFRAGFEFRALASASQSLSALIPTC